MSNVNFDLVAKANAIIKDIPVEYHKLLNVAQPWMAKHPVISTVAGFVGGGFAGYIAKAIHG